MGQRARLSSRLSSGYARPLLSDTYLLHSTQTINRQSAQQHKNQLPIVCERQKEVSSKSDATKTTKHQLKSKGTNEGKITNWNLLRMIIEWEKWWWGVGVWCLRPRGCCLTGAHTLTTSYSHYTFSSNLCAQNDTLLILWPGIWFPISHLQK